MISPTWVSFVDNFINSLSKMVPINSFFSYELSSCPNKNISDYYYKNLSAQTIHSYIDKMFQYDPLFYKNNNNSSNVALLNEKNIPLIYQQYLNQNKVIDNIELYFKDGKHNIGSISLNRFNGESNFSTEEVVMIQSCYDLASFNTKNLLEHNTNSLNHPYQDILTKQEKKVIMHVLQGKKNQDIANELFVSLTTIKTHLRNIFKKLNVKSKQELIIKVV